MDSLIYQEAPVVHLASNTFVGVPTVLQYDDTAAGEKTGVTLRHPGHATVCERNGKAIFEIIREDAAALKTQAELYTPDGSFIKCADESLAGYILRPQKDRLQISGLTIMGCTFQRMRIGVWVKSDGSVALGVA